MLENRSIMRREGILDQVAMPAEPSSVALRTLPPEARFVLRLGAGDATRNGSIAGLSLALPINRFGADASRLAARLGPDEWLLIGPDADAETMHADAARALAGTNHALVDISHRNVGMELSGRAAAVILNAGCSLDLGDRQFPPGSATRTLLGKAEVVLFRLADVPDRLGVAVPHYRIECWRSFARYVHGYLAGAAAEYAAVRN